MEKKKSVIWKVIAVLLLIAVAAVSIFVVSDRVSDPKFHENSIKILDEKKMNIVKLTGAAAAASTAISAIPGDATTPIANEIMDMASYLLVITVVLYLEKLLLTMTGLVAFKFLIPIACGFGLLFVFWKKDPVKNLAIKLAILGILLFTVVPLSVYIASWIENNYQDTINLAIESADSIDADETKEEGQEMATEEQAEEQGEEQEGQEENEGFLKGLVSKAQEVTQNVKEEVTTGVTEGIEKAQKTLSNFIDAIAVFIITTCVIPILVLLFFVWVIKIGLGVTIPVPTRIGKKKKKKNVCEEVKADIV